MTYKFSAWHAIPLLLALLAGTLTLVPQLVAEHRLGASYVGIHKEVNDDELYYVTRAHEVIDGHPTLGNPYLYEHKGEPPMQVWITDMILAEGSMIIFGDLRQGSLAWDFLWPAVIVLLTYAYLVLLTRERLLSFGVTFFLSIGTYLVAFNRSPSPQFNFVFFLLFLIALLQVVLRRKRSHIVLCAIALGILFWIYTYYWTYAVVLLGLLGAGYFLFFRKERLHWKIVSVLGGGILLGTPYLWSTWKAASLPYYQETLLRVGLIHTHSPSGIFIVGVGTAILLMMLVLWRLRVLAFTPASMLAASAVLAGIIAVNQHLITGLNLEFSSHYHLVAMYSDILALALCAEALLERAGSRRVLLGRGALALVLVLSLVSAVRVVQDQSIATPEFVAAQRYAPVLQWLDAHTHTDDVVYADNALSYLIPAYTHDNIFYRSEAGLYVVPQSDIRKRFLIYHYFDATFNRDSIAGSKEIERQIYGNYYLERAAHMQSLNTLRHMFGLAPLSIERYPEADMQALVREWELVHARPFTEALAGYRVDYVAWDRSLHPEWNLDRVEALHKVYENGSISIYAFPKPSTP